MKKFKITRNIMNNGAIKTKEEVVLAESFRKIIDDYDFTSTYDPIYLVGRKKTYDYVNNKFKDNVQFKDGTMISTTIEGV